MEATQTPGRAYGEERSRHLSSGVQLLIAAASSLSLPESGRYRTNAAPSRFRDMETMGANGDVNLLDFLHSLSRRPVPACG